MSLKNCTDKPGEYIREPQTYNNQKGIMKIITDLLSSARFSFRQKIVFVAVSGMIIASVVYTVSAVRSEQRIMRDEFVKRAEVVTRLASQIGELPLISKNPELISKAISSLKLGPNFHYLFSCFSFLLHRIF